MSARGHACPSRRPRACRRSARHRSRDLGHRGRESAERRPGAGDLRAHRPRAADRRHRSARRGEEHARRSARCRVPTCRLHGRRAGGRPDQPVQRRRRARGSVEDAVARRRRRRVHQKHGDAGTPGGPLARDGRRRPRSRRRRQGHRHHRNRRGGAGRGRDRADGRCLDRHAGAWRRRRGAGAQGRHHGNRRHLRRSTRRIARAPTAWRRRSRRICRCERIEQDEWRPPIVQTVATSGQGVPQLVEAIAAFRAHAERDAGPERASARDARRRSRAEQRLRELVSQRFVDRLEREVLGSGEWANVVEPDRGARDRSVYCGRRSADAGLAGALPKR